jgi:hypothetical protein
LDDPRPAALGEHGHALRRRHAVDLALDSEQASMRVMASLAIVPR